MLNDVENYISGNINYAKRDTLPLHIREQVQLRSTLCSSCAALGKCPRCGCSTPKMFYSPNKVDKAKKWAQFFNEEQWTALKENIDEYQEFFRSLRSSDGGPSGPAERVQDNT